MFKEEVVMTKNQNSGLLYPSSVLYLFHHTISQVHYISNEMRRPLNFVADRFVDYRQMTAFVSSSLQWLCHSEPPFIWGHSTYVKLVGFENRGKFFNDKPNFASHSTSSLETFQI